MKSILCLMIFHTAVFGKHFLAEVKNGPKNERNLTESTIMKSTILKLRSKNKTEGNDYMVGGLRQPRKEIQNLEGGNFDIVCQLLSTFWQLYEYFGNSHQFLSDPGLLVRSMCLVLWKWVSKTPFWNLTDVTLADEDTNSILTDKVNRAIQGNVAMQVELMQVAPSGDQNWN